MKKYQFTGYLFTITCIFIFCLHRQAADAACLSFSDLMQNGSYAVATENGELLSSCNPNKEFVPASIIKIQTALAALHILGNDFRFKTEFYVDRSDNLYIKGFGDPYLTSEEVEGILLQLQQLGIERINNIVMDVSNFNLAGQPPGRGTSNNPYDAPVGAIGVNFNSVSIRVDRKGRVVSDEPQTPTLPIMSALGRGLQPGSHRINICQKGCLPVEKTTLYAGELFRAFQRRISVKGDGTIGNGTVPADATLLYTHLNSKKLEDIVYAFLKYSNNYMANQVFLICGAVKYGFPVTWAKAQRAVREAMVEMLGNEFLVMNRIEEGSGLSRQNRTTAKAMILVLKAFKPSAHLLQGKKGASVKSGTLKGIYNYAGYLSDGKPFVIMLNQEKNTRDSILYQLEKKSGRPDK